MRYVRNQIGGQADLAEFLEPGHCGVAAGQGPVTGWTWKPAPEPVLASLPPRGQAWESARYQAYQVRLAGRTIGETISLTAAFLKLTAANAAPTADTSVAAQQANLTSTSDPVTK